MDINKIKSKLNSLKQNKNIKDTQQEKKLLFWKPEIGKTQIRVIPSKYDKDNPFTELLFYYGIGNKTIISPKNFGEKDPIADFVKELRNSNNKDSWKLAKKLEPKTRIFVPIIVRGKEDEGVKLWQFGKEVYMQFLNLADNEEIGDFTDVIEGRDIIVDTVGPDTTKTDYNKSSISPKIKTSPLTDNKELLETWLNEQPNPKELSVYKRYTFDEIKDMLRDFLSPSDEGGEEDEEDEESEPSQTSSNGKNKFEKLFDKK